jgi:hypothetical protein
MAEYRLAGDDTVVRVRDAAFIPNDSLNRDRAAYDGWVAAGGVPDPYVAPLAAAVTSVTPRQARLALLNAGLLDAVQAAVDTAGGSTKITWEYAISVNRDDPLIGTLGAALSLSGAQIDALFDAAAAL